MNTRSSLSISRQFESSRHNYNCDESMPTLFFLEKAKRMCLPTAQVDRFYGIWFSLLRFINSELNLFPSVLVKGSKEKVDRAFAVQVRNVLWEHEDLLGKFITQNPDHLAPEDLSSAENWGKHRRSGNFFITKILKNQTIFISQEHSPEVFAVKGLYTPISEIIGSKIPLLVKTVLLPFDGEIVTDGLMETYNIHFGSGYKSNLKDIYDDARERGAIITSLLPHEQPSRDELKIQAETTNQKVLAAFDKYQYKVDRSPATVERDRLTIGKISDCLLSETSDPHSLRDIQSNSLTQYMKSIPENQRKSVSLSLRRFIQFLMETGRIDWEDAQDLLEIIHR